MSVEPRRLVLSELIDLPVTEESGLAVRRTDRGSVMLVIGVRNAELGACRIGDDGALGEWTILDLATLPGWPLPHGASQFESIAAGGRRRVRTAVDDLDETWDLPEEVVKPEGIVAHGDGRLLVAMDTRSTSGNGMIVSRPA